MNTEEKMHAAGQSYALFTPIIPYVRMTQRGKWGSPRAQDYLANQATIKTELLQRISEMDYTMFRRGQRLRVDIVVVVPHSKARVGDIDNIAKAILDAMQGLVYENDSWIDWLRIQRGTVESEDQQPYCRVRVEEVGGPTTMDH